METPPNKLYYDRPRMNNGLLHNRSIRKWNEQYMFLPEIQYIFLSNVTLIIKFSVLN